MDSTTNFSLRLEDDELRYYSSVSNFAIVTLKDEESQESYPGLIWLLIPSVGDSNGNGHPDFYESAQSVDSATSSGSYDLSLWGSGTLKGSWSRAAGNTRGSCVLEFKFPENPNFTWLRFDLTFELLEYSGPVSYTPGVTTVSGRLDLVQTSKPDNRLGGPMAFVKMTTNRFNALMLQPDSWTNAWQQSRTYTNELFERDVRWPSNYFGYVIFDNDANPATPYPFDWWVLSIDDLNDANHNGVPDFSDDQGGPEPPRPAQVSLAQGATNFWLTISGDIGRVHEVQEATPLSLTDWTTVWFQQLTSDPQVVSLPAPPGPGRFWRVVAR